ncbi:MAG: hypothetical protein WCA38_20215 [Candidatus Acidiferrales bacterium]
MKPSTRFLLLPLLLTSLGVSKVLPQESAPLAWRLSQKTDAARAVTYAQFTLTGKFLKAPQHAGDISNRPAMVVDCNPGKESHKGKFESASLLIGANLKIIYVEPEEIHGTSYFPKVLVHYRVNDAKEEEGRWSPGSDKTSVAVPKDAFKKILRAQTLNLTATDDSGAEILMKFDIPDSKAVEEGCNVDDKQ